MPAHNHQPIPPRHWSLPPRRVLGLLLAAVFAAGLIAGAALGPAPSNSLADSSWMVQRALALLAAHAIQGASTPSATSASVSPAAGSRSAKAHRAASPHVRTRHGASAANSTAASSGAPPSSTPGANSQPFSSKSPSSGETEEGEAAVKPIRLPPIQHVWSIDLVGSTFAAAEAAPTSYPYLVGRLIARGTLLSSYTALDAYELAGDATLLPGGVGASMNVLSEPSCPSAPSQQASSCATDAQTAAGGVQPSPAETDAFLQRVLAPILASPAYGENGLIVISFAPVSSNEDTTTTTFSLQPTAGALLLSPLLRGGARNASTFDSLSPRASVAAIFKH